MSVTVGVDLAAQAKASVIARVEWAPGRARLVSLTMPASDADIVEAVLDCDVAGVDVPLGWPEAFHAFLGQHREDLQPAFTTGQEWRELAFRRTDLVLKATLGQTPLSVSTDRLALPAMRAASLQAQLRARGLVVDRTGAGRVCEAYPAAALRHWGLPFKGYKNAEAAPLEAAVSAFAAAAPWFDFGDLEPMCRATHDCFDAVIAALIARARQLGHWTPPTGEDAALAAREGWIVVPTCRLDDLV